MDREKTIVKISLQGIVMNLLLVGFKAFVGILSNSIAVILDAVNNLGDALSQIITIVGTKLSAKQPDKKHPFGHGRVEYLTSALVACLVLFAGYTSLKESFLKTLHPEPANYTLISLVIIFVAVLVKFFFGIYVKAAGKKVQSQSLIATGTDSFMDSILSLSTLVAALISKIFGLNLEGILGMILSVVILKAGFEILRETIATMIGGRPDSELSKQIKTFISKFDGVLGAYDLILHDYGPSRSIGSVHIEIPAETTATEIHVISKKITEEVYKEFGILLTVGVYASSTDPKIIEQKEKIRAKATAHEYILQMHGFFLDEVSKYMSFDLVISYKAKSTYGLAQEFKTELLKDYPGYRIDINVDHDFSD